MNICFCVGLQRSGTTALSQFLLAQPGVVQPNTSDKREANSECWAAFGRLTRIKGTHIVEPEDLSRLDVWETRLRVWRYWRRGKLLYIKTPKNCVRVLVLKHIFPSCKIIFIRRDPRSILRSWWDSKGYHHLTSGYYQHPYYVKQSDGKHQWCPPPLQGVDLAGLSYDEVIALANKKQEDWWDTEDAFRYRVLQLQGALDYHLDIRSQLPSAGYLDIAYEDLCAKPLETLETLFDFMEIPYDIDAKKITGFFRSQNYKFDSIPEHLKTFAEDQLCKTALRLGYHIKSHERIIR